jgi:hypothetical protein
MPHYVISSIWKITYKLVYVPSLFYIHGVYIYICVCVCVCVCARARMSVRVCVKLHRWIHTPLYIFVLCNRIPYIKNNSWCSCERSLSPYLFHITSLFKVYLHSVAEFNYKCICAGKYRHTRCRNCKAYNGEAECEAVVVILFDRLRLVSVW